ncbi:unnamed protein product [Auanema sp. JU1783]|nr:unnamed protein product [Auanema sp. JU1783]
MNVLFIFFTVAAVVEAEIEMLQVLFRHGDRAPSFSYPYDVYNETSWSRGYSQLTENGYEQSMELGNYLNQRYSTFLRGRINKNTIYARSSDKDRCIETAMGVTRSLFPDNLVPVHTYSSYKDDLLLKPTSLRCDVADQLVRNDKKKLYKLQNQKFSKLFSFLTAKTGMTVDMSSISDLYNVIYREHSNGLTQPTWVFDNYKSNLTIFDMIVELKRQDRMETFNSFLKSKLRTGYLLGQLVNEMEARASGKIERKMSLYSTHDATITSLMYSMGIANHLLVPYTSALIFELHRLGDQRYVKILYRNSTNAEPYAMKLAGCSDVMCPLKHYHDIFDSQMIDSRESFEQLCTYTFSSWKYNNMLNLNHLYYFIIMINSFFVIHFYFTSLSKEYHS